MENYFNTYKENKTLMFLKGKKDKEEPDFKPDISLPKAQSEMWKY